MKTLFPLLLLFSSCLFLVSCTGTQPQIKQAVIKKTLASQTSNTITDVRDGETYQTVTIGAQRWMSENVRYNIAGSILSPNNPSPAYGRLYNIILAQKVCPKGWHLPSDTEWNTLELAHGMPPADTANGGWRGEHGTNMKTTTAWDQNGNGTNTLGFNILPAGYYFSGKKGGERGIHGIGYSAGFWSSMVDSVGYARFLFSTRKWVNKWDDRDNDTEAALSCRCIED